MPLSEEDIKKINWGYSLAHSELCELILLMLSFSNSLQKVGMEKSYDYLFYGALRRTYNIKRCLENFKRISPPERNEYLDDDQRKDLTLFFHSFLLHILNSRPFYNEASRSTPKASRISLWDFVASTSRFLYFPV